MSEIQPLIDALPFINFTDRAIGKRFKEALHILDEDLTDEEYEPSPPATDVYKKLAEEIEDASDLEVSESEKPEIPVIKESELPSEAEELDEVVLDPEDEDESAQ